MSQNHTYNLLICLVLVLSLFGCGEKEKSEASYSERFAAIFQPAQKIVLVPDTTVANRKGSAKQASVQERYPLIYNLIHQEQQAYYQNLTDSSYTNWDSLQDYQADIKYLGNGEDTILLARNIKVFGWHPHWMGSTYKNYNFKLLSHVALFSYNVNVGDGNLPYDNPEVIENWRTNKDFDLVQLAEAAGSKVLITITNFGRAENRIFLNDIPRQERLIKDVCQLLIDIEAHGIDLDFEEIPPGYEKRFSDFVRRLRSQLLKLKKDYLLTVVLPKINRLDNGNTIYNIDTLQHYVDFFTLTAYDFTTGDYAPGAIAPLYNANRRRLKNNSIEDIVFNYLEAGLDRKKLLLGLPYYGGEWTRTTALDGRVDSTFQHLTHANIRRQYQRMGTPFLDRDAYANVFSESYVPAAGAFARVEKELWFDDSLTLSVKYDWVLEQGLAGVGIWALGYDQPYTDLWALLDDKFAPINDTLVYYQPQEAFNLPLTLLTYRNPIAITALFLFCFLTIGFVWALFDWRVREVFFENKTLRILYIAIAFTIIAMAFTIFLFLQPDVLSQFGTAPLLIISLIIGLLIGAWSVKKISTLFEAARNKVP